MQFKFNKEMIILTVLLVLLSAYLIFRNQNKLHYKIPKLKSPSVETVNRIEIKGNGVNTVLEKQNDKWLILPKNYPASSDLVNQMLDQILHLKLDVPVSQSGQIEAYGFATNHRLTVRAITTNAKKHKSSVFEFAVGLTAPTGQHTYVLLNNSKTVYQAEGTLRRIFSRPIAMLRDKQIFNIAKKDITNILLEAKGKKIAELSLQTKNLSNSTVSYWKSSEGWDAQPQSISDILGTSSRLLCQTFLEDRRKDDFKNKIPSYRITLQADKPYTLSFYEKKDQHFVATASTSPYVFTIPKWQAERIIKKRKDLVQKK